MYSNPVTTRRKAETALRLGAHTSIAGGLHKALERGAALGCRIVQVFSKPNKQWAAKPILPPDLEAWFGARERTGVEPAMVHTSYLINVGSPDAAAWTKSYQALLEEYRRCQLLRIPYMIMHPGAHLGAGEAAGVANIARALTRLLRAQPDNETVVLLENTAGQGTNLGHRFEHLRDLLAAVDDPQRVGVCVDTCHTLAAGYDLTTPAGWEETFAEFERVVGTAAIQAFHVNDSKRELGSRVDRHEHIGRGHLGLTPFRCLVNDPRFRALPLAIETPKPSEQADLINLAILRALAGRKRVTSRAKRLATQSLDLPPE